MKKGSVIWITGLSGAGKTTISSCLIDVLKKHDETAVMLDGDQLRKVLHQQNNHDLDNRKKLAKTYAGLCRMISSQGFDVVCATVSMFHEVHAWNRNNIRNYIEVYLQVPISILQERDQKGLYSASANGEIKNVAGVGQKIEVPEKPDIVINNDGKQKPEQIAEKIYQYCLERGAFE